MTQRILRYVLVGLDAIIGLSAVAGGAALVTGLLQMPLDLLATTPFTSYLIPGLILAIIVGGAGIVAAFVTAFNDLQAQVLSSFVAGAILTGWTVIETIMLGYISFLQPLMVGLGVITMSLAAFQWLAADRPSAQRPRQQLGW
jgi:hypothetical protein